MSFECWRKGIAPGLRTACLLLAFVGGPAHAQDTILFSAVVHLYLNTGLLSELGVSVTGAPGLPDPVETTMHDHVSPLVGSLVVELPSGSYEGFAAGALAGGVGPTLGGAWGSVALDGYRVEAAPNPLDLLIVSASAEPLFWIDHIHTHYEPVSGSFEIRNADLRVAPELAARLGDARLTGLAVGLFELESQLAPQLSKPSAPQGLVASDGGDCVTPNFNLPIDVALVDISSLQQSDLVQARVAITPSATLRNVGVGDVQWEAPLAEAHPMLAWAMYRESGGVFEQIGASATKHAFNAQNTDCPCASGNVLWAGGCMDVYGTFTNADRSNLAPRDEITAHLVGWDSCGSLMDPECDDVRNFPTPADGLERRLHVAEADLRVDAANYYFEAWYLVKDDIDIFNSMGWRKVTPLGSGFWTFSLDTSLANGPSLDAWVPRETLTASASAQVHATGVGQFEVASKVVDQGGGLHRYEYALMNFDFDRQLNGFSVPLEPGSTVSQLAFSDATDVASDDWTPSVGANSVSWNAPAGLGAEWGEMRRMAFSVDQAPQVFSVLVSPLEPGTPDTFSVAAPVPLPEPRVSLQLLFAALALLGLRWRRKDLTGVARDSARLGPKRAPSIDHTLAVSATGMAP